MIQIARPDHPLLRGLRFFGVANNTVDVQNIAARGGGSGAITGGATLGRLGREFSAVQGDGTDNLVTFDATNLYAGSDLRDITVICRCKSNADHTGGVICCRNASLNGWQILMSNFGAAERGYNFTVFGGASKFQEAQDGFTSAQQAGLDVVVAGKYVHADRAVYIYTRQPSDPNARLRNSRTNTNSGTPTTEDWDVRSSQPLLWLKETGASTFFNGDVAWCMIFDCEKSNEEIAELSMDEKWEFLEDYPLVTSFTARTYRTLVGVSGSAGYSQSGSSREYDTAVDAVVEMSGDMTNTGSGSTLRSFRTEVEVRGTFYYGIPLLKRFRTIVGVEGNLTVAQTRYYRTLVGARGRGNLLLDGRRDLLYTGGYRR